MSFGKPKPVAQRVETRGPPAWLLPYLSQGAQRAEQVYQSGGDVQPQSRQTLDALAGTEALARSNPNMPALDAYQQTLSGSFVDGPGFNNALSAATNRIVPQVQSMFARGGRTGSGLAQSEMARQIADSFAGLYNAERGRQHSALSMAPVFNALQYDPMQRLAGVGQAVESQDPSEGQRLDNYLARLSGVAPFAGSTHSSPIYQNRTNQALGLGLGLLGMFL